MEETVRVEEDLQEGGMEDADEISANDSEEEENEDLMTRDVGNEQSNTVPHYFLILFVDETLIDDD